MIKPDELAWNTFVQQIKVNWFEIPSGTGREERQERLFPDCKPVTTGATPVQAGLFSMKLPIKKVAGTSLMIIFVNTLFTLTGLFLIGTLGIILLLFLTLGTIVGAIFGTRRLANIKTQKIEPKIRRYYTFLILILGLFIIFL